jgi:hypothetical protein
MKFAITQTVSPDIVISAEPLLTVADNAFKLKFGDNTDKVLPRAYGSEVISYDSDDYGVQGTDWHESDLQKLYPNIWKAYNY